MERREIRRRGGEGALEQILYEDGDILVVYKPGGMPVQTRRASAPDLVCAMKNYRAKKGEDPYIGIVHRLDQPVEGVMLLAKTKRAAASLSGQIRAGQMEKSYLALACQRKDRPLVAGDCGKLTDYLQKDGRANVTRVVREGTAGAKKAVLQYEALRAGSDYVSLRIRLETGRHHQIRVQMAHAGMPLAGDRKYGREEGFLAGSEPKHAALCSACICFRHPVSNQLMKFETLPKNPAFQLLHA